MSSPPQVHPLLVLYGSQTGTAQDVAELIARQGARRGFCCRVLPMDDYDRATLPNERLVVFVAATSGDGEAPDNMKAFWTFLLRKALPADALADMRFAVFGLGDSSYPKFNAVARKLNVRLQQLGAMPFVERGLGDDQSPRGMEGDLHPWLQGMWAELLRHFPLPSGAVVDDSPQLTPPRFPVRIASPPPDRTPAATPEPRSRSDYACSYYSPPAAAYLATERACPVLASVTCNRRITAGDWEQDTRHIELDISGCGLRYRAGDVALVYPQNVGDVDAVARMLGLAPEAGVEGIPGLPSPCTVRLLLARFLDIHGTPRRYFFEQLSFFATDEEEREKLLELGSLEGADLLLDYCVREKRSYVEVLTEFRSARPPIQHLVDMVPRLRPRQFSIASSQLAHPNHIQLTVAIVDFLTPYKRRRKGVCTSWMSQLREGDVVPLWVTPGTMRVPATPNTPMLLIGPGTGIAPMRALVEEHACMAGLDAGADAAPDGAGPSLPPRESSQLAPTAATAPRHVLLFFGCRRSDKDYYYREQWARMVRSAAITDLHIAFSRDQASKLYVQGRLLEWGDAVYRALFEHHGVCFVAGSAKRMPSDVLEAVTEVYQKRMGCTMEDALRAVRRLQMQGRYIVEAWS